MPDPVRITIVGTGYVGLVSGICLASKGHQVRVLDLRPIVVESINRGIPTIHEEGLPALLADVVGRGRLHAAIASEDAIGDADLVLICVGTPSKNGAIDLTQIREAAGMIGRWLRTRTQFAAVVVKSTVIPGTTDTEVRETLEAVSGKKIGPSGFGLGMNPEFLREGNAVEDFMAPDRIVFGHEDAGTLRLLQRTYAPWDCEKMAVNSRTAEMIKYANNCLLALQISAANELANVASARGGIDFMDVLKGVSLDKRWNPRDGSGRRTEPAILTYLVPGCGFGGSCFPKDVEAMRTLAVESGIEPHLLQAVLDVNESQPVAILDPLVRALGGSLQGKTILLLGMAFKPGTDDVRESASLRMARHLVLEGARVLAHDPIAMTNALEALGAGIVEPVEDWRKPLPLVDAVIVAARWPEYQELVTKPAQMAGKVLLDARRMFSQGQFPGAQHLAVGYRVMTKSTKH